MVPRTQDTLNNNSFGKKYSWQEKVSRSSSPLKTGGLTSPHEHSCLSDEDKLQQGGGTQTKDRGTSTDAPCRHKHTSGHPTAPQQGHAPNCRRSPQPPASPKLLHPHLWGPPQGRARGGHTERISAITQTEPPALALNLSLREGGAGAVVRAGGRGGVCRRPGRDILGEERVRLRMRGDDSDSATVYDNCVLSPYESAIGEEYEEEEEEEDKEDEEERARVEWRREATACLSEDSTPEANLHFL
ncbi:hypothetical protein J4Q44_G00132360 [Coregonus suidteri]|uniref:Uncharacterized protein n=1 Tax=Coregonus suidteri TaxID=861788 RepID=A0AAN8R6V0_9TELE